MTAGNLAGICGNTWLSGNVRTSYNIGKVSGEYSDAICWNLGDSSAYVATCFYLSGIGLTSNTGTEKTSTELKSLASTLGTKFKDDKNNINDGYPILFYQ